MWSELVQVLQEVVAMMFQGEMPVRRNKEETEKGQESLQSMMQV